MKRKKRRWAGESERGEIYVQYLVIPQCSTEQSQARQAAARDASDIRRRDCGLQPKPCQLSAPFRPFSAA